MRIQLLFFGAARERAGVGEADLDLPPDGTLDHAIALISQHFPAVVPLLPYLRFAVNQAFEMDRERALQAGDVVAVIPPVAGGAPRVALWTEPLDPRAVEALVATPDCGGVVTFLGAVRNHTGPHAVAGLHYEAYEPMALQVMEALCAEVEAAHPPARLACHHRLGTLEIGDLAVVVVAAAPHRATAFAACQRYIDRLKEDVPIFKRETRADGSVWVGLGP